uniref:Uncharacterized protein n=1 Tax=Ciona intestinalis TaxID=7719 RepID=F6WMV9_CIOIN
MNKFEFFASYLFVWSLLLIAPLVKKSFCTQGAKTIENESVLM